MKNIALKHYISLPDPVEYDALLGHLLPENLFCGRQMDANTMSWANVKYCIRQLPKIDSWDAVCELFGICFGVEAAAFLNAPVTDFFAAKKHLIAEFTRIIDAENRLLSGHNTDSRLWEIAGAGKLKPYSDTLPLVQLGKLFGQYPFDLARRPYGEILSLLAQARAQNEVEAEYRRLKG